MNSPSLKVVTVVAIIGLLAVGCRERGKSYLVQSSSMEPTLRPGKTVRAVEVNPKKEVLKRFDIVIFTPPFDPGAKFAFRIVGLPNEKVEITSSGLLINDGIVAQASLPATFQTNRWIPEHLGEKALLAWTLDTDEYFVVGDNLLNARDSRTWGPIHKSNIVAIVEEPRK